MAQITLKEALAVAANTANGIKASGSTPIEYTDTVFDDELNGLTASKRGSNLKPDYDYTNMGLLFPQNDTSEIAYLTFQFHHKRKSGTNIKFHLHWQQMNSNSVVWKIDYKWIDNGEAVPANFTTIAATGKAFEYSSGNLAQIETWPEIDGSGITGVSSILLVKLYRDDNVDGGAGSGDALAFYADCHFEIDGAGSSSEYTK